MDRIEHGMRRVSRILAWFAGLLILALAVLVTLDVFARALFDAVFFESFELSGYGFAAALAFGLAHTALEKSNIRVDLLNARMPRPIARAADLIGLWLLAAFAALLAWHAAQVVIASLQMGARSNSALGVPLVYPQGLWAFGIGWFGVVSVFLALRALLAALGRDWPDLERIAGLRGATDGDRETV